MLHRATAACFDTWLDAARERRRQRALLGRALQRLTRRRQAAALAAWRSFALASGSTALTVPPPRCTIKDASLIIRNVRRCLQHGSSGGSNREQPQEE